MSLPYVSTLASRGVDILGVTSDFAIGGTSTISLTFFCLASVLTATKEDELDSSGLFSFDGLYISADSSVLFMRYEVNSSKDLTHSIYCLGSLPGVVFDVEGCCLSLRRSTRFLRILGDEGIVVVLGRNERVVLSID